MPRGPQESFQCRANCWDQILGVAMTSVDLLCDFIWSQLHFAGSQDWVLEKLVVSLHLSLFFPLLPPSISASVFFPALPCVSQSHYSLAQHTSKHRGWAVTGCCASLSCSNLPCAMRNSGASIKPLSLWAQLNQFSVHCLGLRVCTRTRRVIWVKCASLLSHDSSVTFSLLLFEIYFEI